MKERIIFSGYTGAPEQSRASVNGQPLDIRGTKAAYYIACRNFKQAREEIKREYRKTLRANKRYIYGFTEQNTKRFYYITALSFAQSDDLNTRLYCYKELKRTLLQNPPTVTTESGYITPNGATKPTRETITARINYKKLLKIRLV